MITSLNTPDSSSHLIEHPFNPHTRRPTSIRRKIILHTLCWLILTATVIALNTYRCHMMIYKSGLREVGPKGILINEDWSTDFEEPDEALLGGRQPREIGCDVPLDDAEDAGKLIFLGIFSAAGNQARRNIYRDLIIPDFPTSLITIKFIVGLPPLSSNPILSTPPSQVFLSIRAEQEKYGDMIILPIRDNVDLGKTHAYFQWVANEFAGEGRIKNRPRFVIKSDDDTILVMPNLISAFRNLDCAENIYWGTGADRSPTYGPYFKGLAYGLSWPLVSWIGSANISAAHKNRVEDARTGQWLRLLDPQTDLVRRIDMGWTMGDFNQLDITIETVALHWLKRLSWIKEQYDQIRSTWADAGIPYDSDHGIDPELSIEKGKIVPRGLRRYFGRGNWGGG